MNSLQLRNPFIFKRIVERINVAIVLGIMKKKQNNKVGTKAMCACMWRDWNTEYYTNCAK
jgi:hypothetical protein